MNPWNWSSLGNWDWGLFMYAVGLVCGWHESFSWCMISMSHVADAWLVWVMWLTLEQHGLHHCDSTDHSTRETLGNPASVQESCFLPLAWNPSFLSFYELSLFTFTYYALSQTSLTLHLPCLAFHLRPPPIVCYTTYILDHTSTPDRQWIMWSRGEMSHEIRGGTWWNVMEHSSDWVSH